MVTEATKDAVWDGLLDATRDARYYAIKADRHLKKKHLRDALTAVVGLFATGSLIFPPWNFLIAFAGALLIVVVILDRLWPNQSTLLASIDEDLSSIARKYEDLFRDVNSEQIDEATAKYARLMLEDSIEKACARVNIPFDERLRDQVQADAFNVAGEKFAYSSR